MARQFTAHKKRPAAGLIQTAGRHELLMVASSLDHAEYDGADNGEGKIRGDNAQFAAERTHPRHGETSLVHVAVRDNVEISKPFPAEKVSLAALSRPHDPGALPATWLKNSENNALKSP
jgi:hypothetical protein